MSFSHSGWLGNGNSNGCHIWVNTIQALGPAEFKLKKYQIIISIRPFFSSGCPTTSTDLILKVRIIEFFVIEDHPGGAPNSHQDSHRSPSNMDDGSCDGQSESHGHGRHMEHITQLQIETISPIKAIPTVGAKDSTTVHNSIPHKRKLSSVKEPRSEDDEPDEESDIKISRKNLVGKPN